MSLRLNVGNLDNVKEGFDPIPEGVYRAQIAGIELRDSKSAEKSQYLNVKLTIQDDGDYMGRIVFGMVSLKPNALWKLKEFCKAADIAWDADGVDIDGAIGSDIFIKVTQDLYEGKVNNKVDSYMPLA